MLRSALTRRHQLRPLKLAAIAVSVAALAHGSAMATTVVSVTAAKPGTLRICAAGDEQPFSNRDGTGFENKIAVAVADAMGRKAEFVWHAKPSIYLVRDQLEQRLCDVVMGLDTGDTRVLTTRPYYRSGYVFIQRSDSPLKIESWTSTDLPKALKIGFPPGSPAETMMQKLDLFRDQFNYMHSLSNFQSKRNKFLRVPPERMVNEVADGTADLAVHFAPEVARYAKSSGKIKLTVIPDDNVRSDGERVPHHFDQSIGVRKDDKALLAEIDIAIEKAKPRIDEILKSEGIPLLPVTSGPPGKASSIDQMLGPEFE